MHCGVPVGFGIQDYHNNNIIIISTVVIFLLCARRRQGKVIRKEPSTAFTSKEYLSVRRFYKKHEDELQNTEVIFMQKVLSTCSGSLPTCPVNIPPSDMHLACAGDCSDNSMMCSNAPGGDRRRCQRTKSLTLWGEYNTLDHYLLCVVIFLFARGTSSTGISIHTFRFASRFCSRGIRVRLILSRMDLSANLKNSQGDAAESIL